MQIWKPRNHLQGQETNNKTQDIKKVLNLIVPFDNGNEKSIIEISDKNYIIKGEIR